MSKAYLSVYTHVASQRLLYILPIIPEGPPTLISGFERTFLAVEVAGFLVHVHCRLLGSGDGCQTQGVEMQRAT